jgi:hypothetical protein
VLASGSPQNDFPRPRRSKNFIGQYGPRATLNLPEEKTGVGNRRIRVSSLSYARPVEVSRLSLNVFNTIKR